MTHRASASSAAAEARRAQGGWWQVMPGGGGDANRENAAGSGAKGATGRRMAGAAGAVIGTD